MPCALATIVAVLALGPPLGHAFLAPGPEAFWPGVTRAPEPVEHARYLIALLGPAIFAATIVAAHRRRMAWRPKTIRIAIGASQVLLLAFLLVCFAALNDAIFHAHVDPYGSDPLFPHAALAAAAAVPLLAWLALRGERVAAAVMRWVMPETSARRTAALLVAVLFTAAWLLTAVNSEGSIGLAQESNLVPWDMSEAFAVLNGRTPLVDFHSQYTQLWAFPLALVMALLGATAGVWTMSLALLNAAALLAIYGILRRIVRSSVLTLVLFLPLLAVGFVRDIPVKIYTLWPLRYAAPYLVAWLVARHVGDSRPRRLWLVFAAASLAVVNNPEFGTGAFAGTLIAVACARPARRWMDAVRLLGSAAGGALGAVALVSLLTLVRAGQLPHFAWMLEFSRIYGVGGWVLEPMATLGFHLVVYVTFTAAIATAVVRAVRRAEEPVLTAMLAWTGGFGLLAGSYFVGRSDPTAIITLFSAWAFSLVLLLVVVVRDLAARRWRRPSVAGLTVLFGFGLMTSTLVQLPTPWSQLDRLRAHTPTLVFKQPRATAFVARTTERGERVAILIPLGHRIAYDLGLVNVSPYASAESMPTVEQMQRTLDAVRRAHVHRVFVSQESMLGDQLGMIERAGFTVRHRAGPYSELSDFGAASS